MPRHERLTQGSGGSHPWAVGSVRSRRRGRSPGLAAVASGVTKEGAVVSSFLRTPKQQESQYTTRHSVSLHSRGTRGVFAQSETEVPFVTASACPV
eukprot:4136504-Pyramimonas_sp.AAC.1